ncbi:hypothetical protein KBY82_11760 [Cyanobium sp. AMD-g]|uniref:hypothetical protein n=1 Tax=Cyanobium sp. AMD-g TaxID=2823699 RepID=UPI0020CD460A|nr:hypothetical protein [Cyanobium sp. AMD-g]MCP9931458.1 hypothetical protein [Cyanobium sp. AMD-g]
MTHRMLLELLAGKSAKHSTEQKLSDDDGFSFLAVLFVVLVLTLGTLAVANRNSLGSLGSAYQSQGRIARAAAETGMTQLVSELNRPRNRPLLVNAESLNLRTVSAIQTAAPGTFSTQDLQGKAALNPDLSATFGAGTLASQLINVGDGSQQRWQVKSISTSNPTLNSARQNVTSSSFGTVNTGNFTVSVGSSTIAARTGEITFTVEGYAYQGGNKVATATLRKTFEVVPKCQDRSLNGYNSVWGNDTRKCTLGLGLLFLAGAANNGTGTFDVTGNATKLNVTPTCITPTGTCTPFDLTYNPIVYTPPAVDRALPLLTTNLQNVVNKCQRSSATYLGNATCNFTNTVDYNKTSPLSTNNFAAWPLALRNICAQETISGKLITVCSFNRLTNSSNLRFDTAGGPIRFFFPNPDINATTPTVTNGSGGNSISQINTTTAAPVAGDFAWFGCNITQCPTMPFNDGKSPNAQVYAQKFEIDVGNGSFGPGFTYFPYGLLFAGGSGGFQGAAWQNGFDTQGSTTLNGTQADLDSIAALMGITGEVGQESTPPLIDYILRSVREFRFF